MEITTDENGIRRVTITEKEYKNLLTKSALVDSLNSAGVDNWSGYSYAMQIMSEEYPEEYDAL